MLAVMLDNILVKKMSFRTTRARTIAYAGENRHRGGEEAVCTKLILST